MNSFNNSALDFYFDKSCLYPSPELIKSLQNAVNAKAAGVWCFQHSPKIPICICPGFHARN